MTARYGFPAHIAEAEGIVARYSLSSLAEVLATVTNSGGVDALQIAAAREIARRVLGAGIA